MSDIAFTRPARIVTPADATFTSSKVGAATADFTRGLVNWWPMDDANVSGSTVIDVIGGNNGTAGAGVTSAAGPGSPGRSTARQYSGSTVDGFITLTSQVRTWLTSFSIAGWVLNPDVTLPDVDGVGSDFQTYFFDGIGDAGGNQELRVMNRNLAVAGHVATNCCANRIRPLDNTKVTLSNQWFHYIYTNNGGGSGGTLTSYLNGAQTGPPNTVTNPEIFAQNAHFFGTMQPGTAGTAQNGMRTSSWRVYNRVLSPQDAQALFLAGG